MAKFEVFIPAAGAGTFDLTFRVEAENWLGALNTGLKKIGEKGGAGTGFLVDIQDDNSIHVTDPKSQRVFRITEKEEETQPGKPPSSGDPFAAPPNPFDPQPGRSTQIELPSVSHTAPHKPSFEDFATLPPTPAVAPERPAPVAAVIARPITEPELSPIGGPARSAMSATLPGGPLPLMPPAPVNTVRPPPAMATQPATIPPTNFNQARPPSGSRPKSGYTRRPSGIATEVTELPREQVRPPTGKIGREKVVKRSDADDVLAELFERVQELQDYTSPEEALDFVLDLAMEKIAAESGSIFLADLSTNDLTLGTARGPKSKELLRLNPRIPMGVGIVGFCAQEAISLAISDAQRDPRFFRAISDRIGYATRTILCVPMFRNGRSFGCLEVLNKKTSTTFTEGEVAILAYLADATASYLERLT